LYGGHGANNSDRRDKKKKQGGTLIIIKSAKEVKVGPYRIRSLLEEGKGGRKISKIPSEKELGLNCMGASVV